jgi:hypothetical protein
LGKHKPLEQSSGFFVSVHSAYVDGMALNAMQIQNRKNRIFHLQNRKYGV